VELDALDEVENVWDLHHEDPVRVERDVERGDETVHVVDMTDDVLRRDDQWMALLADDAVRDVRAPVLGQGRDPARVRFGREIARWVDADDSQADLAEAREEETVVARDVQREVRARRLRVARDRLGELRAVRAQRL